MNEFRFVLHYDMRDEEHIYSAHRITHKEEVLYVVVWGERNSRRDCITYTEKEVIDNIERNTWIILRD